MKKSIFSKGLFMSFENCLKTNSDVVNYEFITAEDLIISLIEFTDSLNTMDDYKKVFVNSEPMNFSDFYEEMEILRMYLQKVSNNSMHSLCLDALKTKETRRERKIFESTVNKTFSSELDNTFGTLTSFYEFKESMLEFSNTIGKKISELVSSIFESRCKDDRKKIDVTDLFALLIFKMEENEFEVNEELKDVLKKYNINYSNIESLILTKDPTRIRCDFRKTKQLNGKISLANNTRDSLESIDLSDVGLGNIQLKEKNLEWNEYKEPDSDEPKYLKEGNIDKRLKNIKKVGKKKTEKENSNNTNNNDNRAKLFDGEDNDNLFEKSGAEGKTVCDNKNFSNNITSSLVPTLDQYGTNLNTAVINGKIDPTVGRDKEINQVIEVLCCRRKSSVMLLGEPGCGKTAIVEGLATRLVNNDVPDCLKGKTIYTICTADLTAGTMYRGQLEERLQSIIKELKATKDIILYIDEFHQSTGEEKSTSIADFLKPALSRGEISLIASTTTTEYKKFIEKDGALKRRFQKIIIKEPSKEDTITILKKLAKYYSEYHKVTYSDEVIKSCVELSDKYIYDRNFPDKAIDVMDISGSFAKLEKDPNKEKAIEELKQLTEEKIKSVCELDIKKANKISKKEAQLKEKQAQLFSETAVTLNNVAEVISKFTNIPVNEILNPEIDKLREMKQNISTKIIGQDEAIKVATTSLSKSFLGLRDENKPIAALMFIGPTGVGKTLLCEEICKTIFGDSKALIRIDCGEYNQPHTVTKLIGAPASYVGYGEPGILDQVRERPHSLILFDEIEKMHADIVNTIFLNILSTGLVKMSNGVEVSFRNSIIVFTGNVGTKELQIKGKGIGFGELSNKEKTGRNNDIFKKALEKEFRPEFINRLTNITIFNELNKEDMSKIFELELNKLKERLAVRNLTVEVSEQLKNHIIDEVDTKYGARDLSRGISTNIEDKICEFMLEKPCGNKTKFSLDIKKNNEIIVKLN